VRFLETAALKQAKNDLRAMNHALERRVRERTAELEHAHRADGGGSR
jgi:nitrate/nitrite-specific signal transduction histidine kinase